CSFEPCWFTRSLLSISLKIVKCDRLSKKQSQARAAKCSDRGRRYRNGKIASLITVESLNHRSLRKTAPLWRDESRSCGNARSHAYAARHFTVGGRTLVIADAIFSGDWQRCPRLVSVAVQFSDFHATCAAATRPASGEKNECVGHPTSINFTDIMGYVV